MVDLTDKILLAKRINTAHASGYFACPGGKLDFGETIHQCILREIKEETGLEILPDQIHPLGYISNHLNPNVGQVITHWFYCPVIKMDVPFVEKRKDGKPKTENWLWHNLSQLPEPTMPGIAPAIEHLYRFVRNYYHNKRPFPIRYGGHGYE